MWDKIETTIAKIITIIFHPLLIPTYFLVILFNTNSFLTFVFQPEIKLKITVFIFIATFLIPFLMILFLYYRGNGSIKSLQMETRKERNIPFILTALVYYLCYYFLKQNSVPVISILSIFIHCSTLLILLALIINLKWKISIHMIGIGGLIGALAYLSNKLFLNYYVLILILLGFAGITGFARLKLKAHQPSQIYTGFILGVTVMFGIFYFILKI